MINENKFKGFLSQLKSQNPTLIEAIERGFDVIVNDSTPVINESVLGRGAFALMLLSHLAFGGEATQNPDEAAKKAASEYVSKIKDQYLDTYNADNDAFKEAKQYYTELNKKDPNMASMFARVINGNLKQFSAFGKIGEQTKPN